MRPFTDISGMHATDVGFASMGMASQMVVGASLDKLEEEIKHELSLLNLTNNKGNKHGFRILTRLKELPDLKSTVPKADWDRYLRTKSAIFHESD